MEQQQQQEESCVPPGFRFHPTEEELVGYYLARKVASQKIDLEIIQEVDLYRIEPWDLQERCKHGGGGGHEAEQQSSAEWYFFSFKDRKYPSGTRTNRATAAGFWKATGRDKPVLSRSRVIGMRKTLVFYRGRAPNGRKTDWIMHEYRLHSNDHAPTHSHEEGWVVCRAFQKPVPNQRPFLFPPTYAGYYAGAADHHHRLLDSHLLAAGAGGFFPGHPQPYLDDDLESKKHLFTIPQLESPTTEAAVGYVAAQTNQEAIQQQGQSAIDWNFLDTLLSTSQLHDSSASSFHLH